MSWTGTPPEFWLHLETQERGALLEKLCEDIIHIQETIKGREKSGIQKTHLSLHKAKRTQLSAGKDRCGNQVGEWENCEHIRHEVPEN